MTTFWDMPKGWKIAYNPHGYSADRMKQQAKQPFAAFDPRGKAILRRDGAIHTFGKFGTAAQAVFEAWGKR